MSILKGIKSLISENQGTLVTGAVVAMLGGAGVGVYKKMSAIDAPEPIIEEASGSRGPASVKDEGPTFLRSAQEFIDSLPASLAKTKELIERAASSLSIGNKKDDFFDNSSPTLGAGKSGRGYQGAVVPKTSNPRRSTASVNRIPNNPGIADSSIDLDLPDSSINVNETGGVVQDTGERTEPGTENLESVIEVVSGGGGGSGGGGIVQSNPSIACSVDKSAGEYGASFVAVVTCDDTSGTINYCNGAGGVCCDPEATPTLYTGPVTIGPGDGSYCFSFYGEKSGGGIKSTVTEVQYIVDSHIPNMVASFPIRYIQSTEIPYVVSTQSVEFGENNHFYHSYNLINDPGVASCEDIYTTEKLNAGSVLIQEDFSITALGSGDQIDHSLQAVDLRPGDNHLAVVIENRNFNFFGCQKQTVVLEDFQTYSFQGAQDTSFTNGVRPFQGGISSFGHFEISNAGNTLDKTTSGDIKNSQSNVTLESNFFTMTH